MVRRMESHHDPVIEETNKRSSIERALVEY